LILRMCGCLACVISCCSTDRGPAARISLLPSARAKAKAMDRRHSNTCWSSRGRRDDVEKRDARERDGESAAGRFEAGSRAITLGDEPAARRPCQNIDSGSTVGKPNSKTRTRRRSQDARQSSTRPSPTSLIHRRLGKRMAAQPKTTAAKRTATRTNMGWAATLTRQQAHRARPPRKPHQPQPRHFHLLGRATPLQPPTKDKRLHVSLQCPALTISVRLLTAGNDPRW
jgi:hypothetical protein